MTDPAIVASNNSAKYFVYDKTRFDIPKTLRAEQANYARINWAPTTATYSCSEYGLEECTMVTMPPQSDDWLATAYSCCDVTLAIGSEGFGYPIVESQACGVPVIHGNYAGGAAFVPTANLIEPVAYVIEGLSPIRRPVFDADAWVEKIRGHVYPGGPLPGNMTPLNWRTVWPKWKKWFEEGFKEL
jgi:glycosyltransferase involved in cell wall biosynthesis